MRIYRLSAYAMLSLFAIAVTIPSVLLASAYSSTASQWIVSAAKPWLPDSISFSQFNGRLAGPMSIEELAINTDNVTAKVTEVSLDWFPSRLFNSELAVSKLAINAAQVRLKNNNPSTSEPSEKSNLEAINIQLPIAISVQDLQVKQSWLAIGDATEQQLSLHSRLALTQNGELTIDDFTASHKYADLSLQANAALRYPFANQLTAKLDLHSPDYPMTHISVETDGDLQSQSGQLVVANSANINAEFSLKDLASEASWQVNADTDTNLTPWLNAFGITLDAPLELDGTIKANGKAANSIKLQPQLSVTHSLSSIANGQPIQALIEGQVQWQDQQLSLTDLSVTGQQQLSGQLTTNGVIHLAQTTKIDLTTELNSLALDGYSSTGRWQVTGPLHNLNINGETTTQQAQLPPITLAAQAQLTDTSLAVSQLRLAGPEEFGFVSGTANVNWQDKVTVSTDVDGTLWDKPLTLDTQLTLDRPYLHIDAANIRWQDNTIKASGALRPGSQLTLALTLPQLSKLPLQQFLVVPVAGDVKLEANVEGDLTNWWINSTLSSEQLSVNEQRFEQTQLAFTGSMAQQQLQLSSTTPHGKLTLASQSRIDDSTLTASLDQLEFRPLGGIAPISLVHANDNASKITFNWNDLRLHTDKICFQQQSLNHPSCLQAQYDEQAKQTLVSIELPAVNLNEVNRLLRMSTVTLDGELSSSLQASLELQKGKINRIDGFIDADGLTLYQGDDSMQFDTLRVDIATKDTISATLTANSDTFNTDISGQVDVEQLAADATLSGDIKAELGDLRFLQVISNQIGQAEGSAGFNVKLSGTLAQANIKPKANIHLNRLLITETGTLLTDVNLSITNDSAQSALYQVDGQGRIGEGQFNLAGDFDLDLQEFDLSLKGNELAFIDTPDLSVAVSPDLTVTVADKTIDVTGDIQIPTAYITPPQMRGVVTPSQDVVIKQQSKEKAVAYKSNADITVSLGDNVNVTAYGFSGQLQGSLNIVQQDASPARGNGQIGVKSGTYEVYGQELTIDKGELVYNGGPLTNPGLNLQVVRKLPKQANNPERVGATVSGTLQNPALDFFSEPTMPDASVLSYLVFGRAPNSTSESSNLELQAALLLTGDMTSAFTENIKDTFGFDEVAIDSETSDVNDTSLYIGKYLTPRLYIKYGIGLVESTSSLFLRYQLTDKLWLESSSSAEKQSGDLIYSVEK